MPVEATATQDPMEPVEATVTQDQMEPVEATVTQDQMEPVEATVTQDKMEPATVNPVPSKPPTYLTSKDLRRTLLIDLASLERTHRGNHQMSSGSRLHKIQITVRSPTLWSS
jgi:hypothetical protein